MTGSGNTAIGVSAGSNLTTGGANIIIGTSAQAEAVGSNNQISIGSATSFVGTDAAANTYFTTATALSTGVLPVTCGFWRVIINGTARKIAVYAD